MRRLAAVATFAVAFTIGPNLPAQADLSWEARRSEVRFQTWLWPRDAFTQPEVIAVISNAARRLGVDPAKALAVADCESGLYPKAVSASGTFRGLFQHHAGYWPGRVSWYRSTFGAAHPKLQIRDGAQVLHPRPNALVAMWMVSTSGWGAWACA
jgi:hypothetical protein